MRQLIGTLAEDTQQETNVYVLTTRGDPTPRVLLTDATDITYRGIFTVEHTRHLRDLLTLAITKAEASVVLTTPTAEQSYTARRYHGLLRGIANGAGHSERSTPEVTPCVDMGLLIIDEAQLAVLTPAGTTALALVVEGACIRAIDACSEAASALRRVTRRASNACAPASHALERLVTALRAASQPVTLVNSAVWQQVHMANGAPSTDYSAILGWADAWSFLADTLADPPPKYDLVWWCKRGRAHMRPVAGPLKTLCGRNAATPAWSTARIGTKRCETCDHVAATMAK